jgi:hypothetical protein
MKGFVLLLMLVACASPQPHSESDLPFCKLDSECTVYRSRCGKFVAFNQKYRDYVEAQFKKREEKVQCGNYPDQRRYTTRCEHNSCLLIER